jgi:hypothetical protein
MPPNRLAGDIQPAVTITSTILSNPDADLADQARRVISKAFTVMEYVLDHGSIPARLEVAKMVASVSTSKLIGAETASIQEESRAALDRILHDQRTLHVAEPPPITLGANDQDEATEIQEAESDDW